MKKIASVMFCFLIGSVGSAFAAAQTSTNGAPITMGTGTGSAGTNPTLVVQLSNTVSMSYNTDSTGTNFIVGSAHGQGTRNFQTSSNDSKIYWSDGTGITLNTVPATGTSVSWGSTWKAL